MIQKPLKISGKFQVKFKISGNFAKDRQNWKVGLFRQIILGLVINLSSTSSPASSQIHGNQTQASSIVQAHLLQVFVKLKIQTTQNKIS